MNTKSIIRCAVFICSANAPFGSALDQFTYDYLKSKGFEINPVMISESIEKYQTGAKLFFSYRSNLNRIQNVGLIQEIYRSLWLYKIVINYYQSISPSDLLSVVNSKYEEERVANEDLTRKRFGCFKTVDREFSTTEDIKASGVLLQRMNTEIDDALKVLFDAFVTLSNYSFMNDLFSSATIGDMVLNKYRIKNIEEVVNESFDSEQNISETDLIEKKHISSLETQLRDEIRVLKKDKHDLEVKLSFAKKDAVRDIITSLTSYGWNCPLSELYRVLKDDEATDRFKGLINNLFMALGSENIKLTKDKVGDVIILNETNQKAYDPYKNEELYLGDKAIIYYPGYRYERETMIRPIVRKIKDEEDR